MAVRVLHVLNNLGSGGAESFLMNMYRAIDREKIQFDFLIRSDKNGAYVDEIQAMGGRVYQVAEFPRQVIRNYTETSRFFREHQEYAAVHVHANSLAYLLPLYLAKKCKIPCRIIHSHSIQAASGLAHILHKLNKPRLSAYATHRLSCSEEAGKWMFGNDAFQVIANGIDLNRFAFSSRSRAAVREAYSLEDRFVVGHVGRFTKAKNHTWALRVFQEVLRKCPKSALLLVGEGEEMTHIRETAEALGLSGQVIFAGAVTNVADFVSAMDCFLFPSIYEGLGIALVEAQMNGLPCVMSDRIPESVLMNDNCAALPLEAEPACWAEAVLRSARTGRLSEKIRKYDRNASAAELEKLYLEACSGNE